MLTQPDNTTLSPCGDTEVHSPHGEWGGVLTGWWCPGLDGTEVTTPPHDPLSVACPSCLAPAGQACEHDDRTAQARRAAVEWGTCGLCRQPLARLTNPVEVVHPDPEHAEACPPKPPANDWNAYAEALNAGLTPGHPGAEHFIPTPDQEPTDA